MNPVLLKFYSFLSRKVCKYKYGAYMSIYMRALVRERRLYAL